ncbi:anthranilate phosphoribosyltransferase [Capnocytophaga cynodegmi]|uniref:anthranilate phosphoribosyltransferase n=1 Tax=Capnocytophaga cynodegmi TaxID=28189 RepID=UPI001AC1615C|nr:anthranilate phosphoribosyltransferase [Capnocytophaga cynodegmi]GIM53127.1 anthranilate phosphoribosyltransferase [Capnocytophaga cynodegmi]
MKQILGYLFNHQTLTRAEAKSIMLEISENKFNESEVMAFITVFLMRSITIDEMEGFREALLELARPVDLQTTDLIDIVGTGGDGKDTFNISTLASFVVAGAGQKVAKQGNYGASSVSGSSNVLEKIGYRFKDNSSELQKDLEKANICFLHAPLFHPALKSVSALRKNLGMKTFFNFLGPLVNPANVNFSLIGVANLEIARLYQYILQRQNISFTIVNSLDGYDEISLTNETKIINKNGEKIFSASELGFENISQESLYSGGSQEESAKIFMNILNGKGTKEQNSVVIANAAMALFSTEKFGSYSNCLEMAKESLESKKALNVLNALIN